VRFQIERETPGGGGLQVLPEIPDITPCLLEGPNGIGKTVAIHLLQLIAGSQPYLAHQQLWTSLKESLGTTHITVDNLNGGKSLTVRLDPSRWPDIVGEPLGDRLGSALLDGAEVPATSIPELLSVVRIAGTETPAETVKRSMATTRARLVAASATVEPRLEAVRLAMRGLRELMRDLDPVQIANLREREQAAHGRVAQAAKDAEATGRRARAINEALEARAALSGREVNKRELQQRLKAVEKELTAARKEQQRLGRAAEDAREQLVTTGVIAEKLAAAEKTLQGRLRRLSNREVEAEEAVAQAGAPPDLAAELRRVGEELSATRLERADVDTGQRAEQVVGRLLADVDLARRDGLADDQVLAYIQGRAITVEELATGLRVRAVELAERPVPGVVEELDARIAELEQRRRRLVIAQDRVSARDRQLELVAEQQEEVAGLRSQLGPDIQRRLQELLSELSQADDQVLDLTREAVDLRAKLSDRELASETDARAALDRAVEESGGEIADLDNAAAEAQAADEQAQGELTAARRELAAVEHELRVAGLAAERAVEELRARPDLLALSGLAGSNGQFDATTVERLAGAVHDVDVRLDDAANGLAALAEAAGALADGNLGGGRLFAEPFVAAAGEQLRADLDTPGIRQVLFDDQPLRELDLRARVLRWIDAEGDHRERPLDAFSTGEQAFAFTQARIRELEPSSAPDRLLVLDEFGAFVSADRMRHLAEFLEADETGAIASQVVVILPLQANYADELKETRGQLRARYQARVDQLADQGYITVPLSDFA
jgi:hypothetical protein